MYSFLAFAVEVCKKCYYKPNFFFFLKNIKMCIKIMQNFKLISNLLMWATKMLLKKFKEKTKKNVKKTKYSKFA